MSLFFKAAVLLVISPFFLYSENSQNHVTPAPGNLKIQAVILLDKSNSMDGLIEQAKAQLWNMVSVMGKAKCNEVTPQIEIALYEYGDPRYNSDDGYVRKLNGFITDLDLISKNLFSIITNGGDEYCGHAIYTSVTELPWDSSSQNYKVIFIAGNEDFLQGDISYTRACAEAKKKGIIVNTIYCGEKSKGIAEHWNLGSECGQGSFSSIDQNAKFEDISTPYDSSITVLNRRLNSTYMTYGARGSLRFEQQAQVDKMHANDPNKSIALERAAVKGNKYLYRNEEWDLVDAWEKDSNFIAQIDLQTLADSLKHKSKVELLQIIKNRKAERAAIQKEIVSANDKRVSYIETERKKRVVNNTETLETEIEKIIREQAKRFNMIIQ